MNPGDIRGTLRRPSDWFLMSHTPIRTRHKSKLSNKLFLFSFSNRTPNETGYREGCIATYRAYCSPCLVVLADPLCTRQ